MHGLCEECQRFDRAAASVSHVKSSIVLVTLMDSHLLPLRAAKSAS
jgi:hypothetical protein